MADLSSAPSIQRRMQIFSDFTIFLINIVVTAGDKVESSVCQGRQTNGEFM